MSADTVIAATAIDALKSRFAGALLRAGDTGYEAARKVWSGCFDCRPALITRCTSVADVQAAVNFAREHSMTVAVRSGGHSNRGYGTWDGAIMIDLSGMKAMEVVAAAQIARAEAGLTWGEFDAATQARGLAVTGGRYSTTGIAGLTLGSGSGWLERRCGLTADNLLEAEIVTADGNVLTANARENPELFWGLRGGGGNFGIVTKFTYGLHQIGPLIYGGLMACLPERAAEVLRFMREYMADAPDDLGAGITFISAPPEPFVPAELHFAPVVGLIICWTGEIADGEHVVAPIRKVAQPVIDMVQPLSYTALQSMLDAGAPYGVGAYMKAEFLPELGDALIEKVIRHGTSRPGPLVKLLLEPMGGAITRTSPDETALGGRDNSWCYHAMSLWMDPSAEAAAAHVTWAQDLAADLAPHTTPGVYLNYTSDEGEERVRSTYGPQRYARLVALKDRYDPTNLFHLNQNIRPSGC
jgi:FAD/FMN-containing dehydrogenase